MRILRRLLALAVLAALAMAAWRFALANAQPVQIDYLAGVLADVPLWLALLGALGLGAALAGLWALYAMARLGLRARRHRKQSEKLAVEVHQLRNMPLTSEGEGLPRGSAGGTPGAGESMRSPGRGV